ncbi:Cryptochrome DASH [Rhynchospora pubera]|uniref:Cryptochrome DASH n=1 Tax=Rhynchospora pubera TaxID=906938 RepID=A0AAV8CR26_9POAL|nr:Cryptochrome DASH [Rhynchospora pubera]
MPRLLPLPSLSHSQSFFFSPKHTRFQFQFQFKLHIFNPNLTMSAPGSSRKYYSVPGITPEEVSIASQEAFRRYLDPNLKRNGNGAVIVWFRNDLRVLDNEALLRGWAESEMVLPVYCVDPRLFGTTHYFRFPKTGALRAKFLIECLSNLKENLRSKGLDLLVRYGKPEDIIPSLAKACCAHTVYAHKETCSEEILVEHLVQKGLKQVEVAHKGLSDQNKTLSPRLQLIWGSTMYHIDDLPFSTKDLPDVYTQYRKAVESKSSIRSCIKLPQSFAPPPNSATLNEIDGWGNLPTLDQLGLGEIKSDRGMHFIGGESAALGRVKEYFWKNDKLKVYKETRNGMLGSDYSTKFSPWLAFGTLSPRYIYEEVGRYENQRIANDSTYWVLFELIWRDYFRFLSVKYGNSIFHLGGPRKVAYNWSQDKLLFEAWKDGRTGYPLIDANMKELSSTGFMSNRGRQIVCSFLVRDMGIDWRMGAEWFETCLIDYDPSSNYGNWTYGAGVGNDPREDRYFSIPKQAKTYDPDGVYVSYWLPELKTLPKERRNFPGIRYIRQIVPLRFDSASRNQDNIRRKGGQSSSN